MSRRKSAFSSDRIVILSSFEYLTFLSAYVTILVHMVSVESHFQHRSVSAHAKLSSRRRSESHQSGVSTWGLEGSQFIIISLYKRSSTITHTGYLPPPRRYSWGIPAVSNTSAIVLRHNSMILLGEYLFLSIKYRE